ncbi:hypothetical protein M2152_000342 [Microbacteriaceae bacterium SG_E_30_P1]|uniref:Uncharacterized protein n=1 Tax=Antiquaquibacter oligotrophicus TaxID=2880260 RepID=A0ABT6KKD7_9MICO|nr:hypothetical protein [Antiquaquibacter oligotrophicus]MDH6180160.1 hypothetical protein [Antiquaquibacter oligotrophicus]UDF14088.1 hypothetical protein LH407_04315 [Antiquaquibacter oligotrophicus]
MATSPGFYLAVGSVLSESVTTRITTSGSKYVSKALSSGPANWRKITELLERPDLTGAIVKLTGKDFERLHQDRYRDAAAGLLNALTKVPHILLVHEAVASAPGLELPNEPLQENDEGVVDDDWDDGSWNDRVAKAYFGTVPDEVRAHVQELLASHGLTMSTYKRNAEASVLAASFVDDSQGNLLFRIYVPSGRLYEDELAKLLELFHDWLGAVKHQTVRQEGYRTPSGRVIEFYGEPGTTAAEMSTELQEFTAFLSVIDEPEAAERMLNEMGLEPRRARELVAKYSKEARRVLLDTKHERDRRTLAIQQQLESELVDELQAVPPAEIERWVQELVPHSPFASSPYTQKTLPGSAFPQLVVQQQFFHHVEGVVAQNVNGSITFGTPADDLIKLIREFGGDSMNALESDTRELSDPGAPAPARIGARQRLKDFLVRNGNRIEGAAFATVWKWLEGQLGG